jgi:hypothetical protein
MLGSGQTKKGEKTIIHEQFILAGCEVLRPLSENVQRLRP